MSKIRLTEADIEKARTVFVMLRGTTLADDGLLPKKMLKALERKGLVEKILVAGRRKYSDVTPPMRYAWLWKNKEEMIRVTPVPSPENKS